MWAVTETTAGQDKGKHEREDEPVRGRMERLPEKGMPMRSPGTGLRGVTGDDPVEGG